MQVILSGTKDYLFIQIFNILNMDILQIYMVYSPIAMDKHAGLTTVFRLLAGQDAPSILAWF